MKSKKLIAIAFSDCHLNLWAKFNEDYFRTKVHFKIISKIKKVAKKERVPVLFTGDMFHKPESIDNELLDYTTKYFSKISQKDFKCYFISGNHDMKLSNTVGSESPSLITSLSRVIKWLIPVDFKSIELDNFTIHGVPYLDHNKGLNEVVSNIKLTKGKPNILMLHTDYPGAKDTDGSEVGSVENLNTNLLDRFNLTLIGHIHKHQRLSKKVYMVGATHQQRRTDRDCELGYIEIYNDLSVKFVSLTDKFPRFIDVDDDQDVKEDGNYYTVLPKAMDTSQPSSSNIHTNLSKVKMAKLYMKERGIEDRDKVKLLINILKKVTDD